MQSLKAFVEANYKYLTIPDMVEESGASRDHIKKICDELGVTPVGTKERTRNFIKEFHKFKTVAQMAKALEMTEGGVKTICNELNIYPLEATIVEKQEKKGKNAHSPAAILGSFQLSGSHHWSDFNENLG